MTSTNVLFYKYLPLSLSSRVSTRYDPGKARSLLKVDPRKAELTAAVQNVLQRKEISKPDFIALFGSNETTVTSTVMHNVLTEPIPNWRNMLVRVHLSDFVEVLDETFRLW